MNFESMFTNGRKIFKVTKVISRKSKTRQYNNQRKNYKSTNHGRQHTTHKVYDRTTRTTLIQYKFRCFLSSYMKSASYKWRNKSSRRGAQLVPMVIRLSVDKHVLSYRELFVRIRLVSSKIRFVRTYLMQDSCTYVGFF